MGSGEVAIVALSTMISLKVTFSDGLGGVKQTKALLFIDFFRRNRLYSHKKMLTLRSYIALKSVFKETDLSYMRFYTYITLFKKPI